MTKITATMIDVSPWCAMQHDAEPDRVNAIIAHVEQCCYDLAPIIVVEDDGNGAMILDGHHRAAAAKKLGLSEIPAWEITIDDYHTLIDDLFDGSEPSRTLDLCEYIQCGGVTASMVANG